MKRLGFVAALITGLLLACLSGTSAAFAQSYPTRPVTLLVGFPPGGPTDTLSRILADGMKQTLGQSVVVETASGASGTIAAGRIAHAAPDGYTIGIGNWTSHVGSPAIYALDYDVFKDLEPISLLAASPLWILGKNGLAPKSAQELIAWLKARKEPTTFATVGAGSAAHLAGLSFARAIGAKFDYVPYRGAGPIIPDLIAGHVDLSCLEASATLGNVQAGQYRAYAVMSEQRWPKSPDTPTMLEAGATGVSITFWHGLWAPKGTPKPIIDKLNAAVMAALADPAVRNRLETLGQVIFPRDKQNPAALLAYHKAETAKWWPIIKEAGIKAND